MDSDLKRYPGHDFGLQLHRPGTLEVYVTIAWKIF